EDWQKISNIGAKVAESIFEYFSDKNCVAFLQKLAHADIKIISPKVDKKILKLKNKIFVLTGSLQTLTREEAKGRIRELGGDISSSVSASVDYVVAGAEPGEKYEKAKKLGVKVINEETFLRLIK
ncbi:MAG: BRCT domain-containing protein, partial [Candidatus Azambacteria bacterium]|nr:BRCT domain-containing protein [Candidatus Azambacteria bacterium]